ncbi:hypothetical protein HJ01_01480 [Flavobacterium frigoris PS1]|uniref:Uncharacterized protein n=1 Tax=Flavobacterium frigoris (strain PS1) TaxID=1086011 RepID=H7FQV7_FLAFP|nr:hypothetical protein HJ01_01480 [Flavobacterium frigoris PS1]
MIFRPSEESWEELDEILNNKIIVNNDIKVLLTLGFVFFSFTILLLLLVDVFFNS